MALKTQYYDFQIYLPYLQIVKNWAKIYSWASIQKFRNTFIINRPADVNINQSLTRNEVNPVILYFPCQQKIKPSKSPCNNLIYILGLGFLEKLIFSQAVLIKFLHLEMTIYSQSNKHHPKYYFLKWLNELQSVLWRAMPYPTKDCNSARLSGHPALSHNLTIFTRTLI